LLEHKPWQRSQVKKPQQVEKPKITGRNVKSMENEKNVTPEVQTEAPNTPTVEELQAKLSALEAEKDKLKKAMDAACSDAAKQKKEAAKWQEQFKATLDEQKRKEFDAEEATKALMAQLSEYKSKERISTYKSKLMSAGYDDITASTMATALPEGIEDTFFEAQRAFLENTKQTIKTQTINSQPGLSVGMPPTTTADAKAKEDADLRKWFGLK
jgi:FtsZ-binding cell division protein ZapB